MGENNLYNQRTKFIKSLRHFPLTKQQIKTLKGQAINGNLEGARIGLERILKRVAKTPAKFNQGDVFRKAHMDTNRIIKKYGGCYPTQFKICLKNAYDIINITREVIK